MVLDLGQPLTHSKEGHSRGGVVLEERNIHPPSSLIFAPPSPSDGTIPEIRPLIIAGPVSVAPVAILSILCFPLSLSARSVAITALDDRHFPRVGFFVAVNVLSLIHI